MRPLPSQGKEVSACLKACGHMFSREGIADLVANRSRKCPACSLKFSAPADVLKTHFVGVYNS